MKRKRKSAGQNGQATIETILLLSVSLILLMTIAWILSQVTVQLRLTMLNHISVGSGRQLPADQEISLVQEGSMLPVDRLMTDSDTELKSLKIFPELPLFGNLYPGLIRWQLLNTSLEIAQALSNRLFHDLPGKQIPFRTEGAVLGTVVYREPDQRDKIRHIALPGLPEKFITLLDRVGIETVFLNPEAFPR